MYNYIQLHLMHNNVYNAYSCVQRNRIPFPGMLLRNVLLCIDKYRIIIHMILHCIYFNVEPTFSSIIRTFIIYNNDNYNEDDNNQIIIIIIIMIINNNNFFVRSCKMNRAQRIIFLSKLNRHLFFYYICKTNTGPRRGIFATMMSRVNLAKTSCTRDSIFNIVVTYYKDQVLMKLCLEIVLAFK